jgi:tripartite-type tricarboxylate transporter receptor subunit TctC
MKIKSSLLKYALTLSLGALAMSGTQAQELPKVIKMVVPFAPGASNDLFARALAQKLSTKLERTVIVENKPGAGGVIGADFVSKAAPDGATLLFTSNALTTTAAVQRKLPYDPEKDLAPIAYWSAQMGPTPTRQRWCKRCEIQKIK